MCRGKCVDIGIPASNKTGVEMKISSNYSLNFGMKFINNNAFKEVENYSKTIKRSNDFQSALSALEKADKGDILIEHGVDQNGKKYSRFILGKCTVENTPYFDESYINATFRSIIDLSYLGSRYKVLTGTNHLRHRPY